MLWPLACFGQDDDRVVSSLEGLIEALKRPAASNHVLGHGGLGPLQRLEQRLWLLRNQFAMRNLDEQCHGSAPSLPELMEADTERIHPSETLASSLLTLKHDNVMRLESQIALPDIQALDAVKHVGGGAAAPRRMLTSPFQSVMDKIGIFEGVEGFDSSKI